MKTDYYELLGIQRGATDEQIKKAYRKMALKYHPDKNQGDKDSEEKFKEITEANDVLSDPEKRKFYDRYGHDWENASKMNGRGFGRGFGSQFHDFKREFERQAAKGASIKVIVNLTLEECYNGCEKEIPYKVNKICGSCSGNGSKNGTSIQTCTKCGGSGQETVVVRSGNHILQTVVTCNSCGGHGRVITEKCGTCDGRGMEPYDEVAIITFPRGVESGQSIAAEMKGHYSRVPDADRGDVIFVIQEIRHENFERDGNNLIYNHNIEYEDILLGTEIEIPTIDDKKVKFNIPPGTQLDKTFRLKGKGMPTINLPKDVTPSSSFEGAFGNCIVRLSINIPTLLSDEERELFKKIREIKNKNLEGIK